MFNRKWNTRFLAALGAVAVLVVTTTQAKAGPCGSSSYYSRPAYSSYPSYGHGGYRPNASYDCAPTYVSYARPVCAPSVVYAEPAYYAPRVVHYSAPVYRQRAVYQRPVYYGGQRSYGYSGRGFGFSYQRDAGHSHGVSHHRGGGHSRGYSVRVGY